MKLALWLLARFAPVEWQESIAGDLDEERRRRIAARRSAGPLWAATAALATVVKLSIEARRSGRRPRESSATRPAFRLEVLLTECRHACRSLAASPGFTAIALVVLTLGIGASTAVFSVVDAVVLRGLPFDEADRLIVVGEVAPKGPRLIAGPAAYPNFAEWKASQRSFQNIAATAAARGFTIREGAEPEILSATRATASLFDVLRVPPRIGHTFTAANEVEGHHRVMLISDGLWRRRFGADPNIVGKTMTCDAGVYEIVGVMPPGFGYPGVTRPADLWVPYYVFEENDKVRTRGRNYSLRVVGRLKDGVSLAQARADIEGITTGLAAAYPRWFEDHVPLVQPLHDTIVGRVRAWMLMLLGAVGCVLLIACVNVANLMLARGTSRSREIGLRAALGASRWQIARGLLIESLILSMAGTLCALLVAAWGVSLLRNALPAGLPRIASIAIDLRVLGVAALAAVVTGALFGLAPALQFSRPNLGRALRDGGRSNTAGRERQRLRSTLVVSEVALAVVMLVGAGLFLSSFVRLARVDLGFDHRNVLTAGVNPFPGVIVTDASLERVRARTPSAVAEVLERVRRLPGVEVASAVAGGAPLSGAFRTNAVTVPGRPELTGEDDWAEIREVTADYARAIRLPTRRGRFVDETDAKGTRPIVVLSEEAVRRYFGEQDPLGVTIKIDDEQRTVVGVVGDARTAGPETRPRPQAYFPFAQASPLGATVVIRTTRDPLAIAPAVKQAVLASLPDVPVAGLTTVETSLQGLVAQRKFNMLLIGLFGVLAVAISTAGIYGVMAYLVAQRTQEIGVRMALGAVPRRVLRMILGRASMFMSAGLAIGLAAAWPLAGLIAAFLFDVRPHDPIVYVGVAVLLGAAGLLAALVPALRAARVDPIIALRSE